VWRCALGFVIRRLDVTDIRTLLRVPDDFGAGGEWERAVDALSPELPPTTPEQRAAKRLRAADSNDDRNGWPSGACDGIRSDERPNDHR
jgi:hypothetical protein